MQVTIPDPWLSFLREVDHALKQQVVVHCLGGFVLTVMWALPRPTGDVDVIEVEPSAAAANLLTVGGEGSVLSERYHLQFHEVTIAEYPSEYASRLVDITPVGFRRLRLMALEVHDLALAKLSRNSQRDREDIAYLASNGALQRQTLRERFDTELKPYLLNEQREAFTLDLWLEEFFPADSH
jgi:hypothetical protein